MKNSFIVFAFLLIGIHPENSNAEDSPPPQKTKEVELKALMRIPPREDESSQADMVRDRGVFMKEGRRYKKFQSSAGSIFVLDTDKLSKLDIESAQCVPGMEPGMSEVADATVAGGESKVGKSDDWKVYAALIQKTIKSKCDGSVQMQVPVDLHLDLGVTHSIKDKDGDKEIRVFNRDLGPNLNFGAHF